MEYGGLLLTFYLFLAPGITARKKAVYTLLSGPCHGVYLYYLTLITSQ